MSIVLDGEEVSSFDEITDGLCARSVLMGSVQTGMASKLFRFPRSSVTRKFYQLYFQRGSLVETAESSQRREDSILPVGSSSFSVHQSPSPTRNLY